MFSGGKDSMAVLALACKLRDRGILSRVDACFMYLVPGLQCIEPKLQRICDKLKVKLWKIPHTRLSSRFKYAVYMPHTANTAKLRKLRPVDTYSYLRKLTGIEWIASGSRREDSLERRGQLTKCQGFDTTSRLVFPIWQWGRVELRAFLKRQGLIAPAVRGGVRSGGVGLSEASLVWLRDRWPEDLKKILAVFPFAEAAIFRHDERLRKQEAA